MRHAVSWIASVALVLGIVILAITRAYSPNRSELYRSAATDSAIALIDLAMTIGVVDLLLRSYSERQRVQSIRPRAREFATALQELRTTKDRYLGAHASIGDLERYKRATALVQHSAFDLYMLISPADAILAAKFLKLSRDMREHSEAVEDAITSIRNASTDASVWVERVNRRSESILESSLALKDDLLDEYKTDRATA